ncbi:MAG: HAD family hydrolase [Chloroflexota bacterium]
MADTDTYWIRPNLTQPRPDTVVFDVDGVLLDETVSFRKAVIATVRHLTEHLGAPPVTLDEVAAFKRAGGLNNDWDCAYVLAALVTAKHSRSVSAGDWPSLEALAAESQGGGVEWVKGRVPAEALPDPSTVRQLVNEHYWGTDLMEQRLGETPRFLKSHRGFVWQERTLIPPGFLDALRAAGARQFGIITGRNRVELAMGLENLGMAECFGCMVSTEEVKKPDPEALWRMVRAFKPGSMVYIGDARDDLDLVINFKATAGTSAPPVLSVVVAPPAYWDYWRQLGADAVVTETAALLKVLESLPLG